MDAKRESVDARARLGRAELDLAVAHRATRQESVGLRQRYEREAQQARLALQAEIRGATVEIREDRDAALKRLEHVESLLKAQGGSENKQLVATKRANKVLMKRVENTQLLRKKERAGFNQITADLKKEIEKLEGSQRRPTAKGEQPGRRHEGSEEEQGARGGAEVLVRGAARAVAVVSARMSLASNFRVR